MMDGEEVDDYADSADILSVVVQSVGETFGPSGHSSLPGDPMSADTPSANQTGMPPLMILCSEHQVTGHHSV